MTFDRRSLLVGAAALGLTARSAFAQAPAAVPVDTRLYKETPLLIRDRFSVEVVGKGPDLIFVPGLSSSRETWKATADRLRGRYRLHLVQLAGFAGEPSRANATGEFMTPVMEALSGYIAEAKLAPAVYVGHSLGGTLGLYLAQKHRQQLKKLLVVDSLPFLGQVMGFPNSQAAKVVADQMNQPPSPAMAAQLDQQIRAMVTAKADQEKVLGWSQLSDGRMVGRAYGEDIMLDLRPGLAAMTTPTTLIYPRGDAFGFTPAQTDAQYKLCFAGMPNLTMVPIEPSRHFIMFDQPERFAAALDAFLKS
jgi:pimeloyl-[acyl-carrier protein] methyl ester esterase